MTKLLKDMPEHMERIENNWSLIQEIEYIIDYEEGNKAEYVLEKLTEFVNQNYLFKGDLPKKVKDAMMEHYEISGVVEAILA